MAQLLTETEIQVQVQALPHWTVHNGALHITRKLKDFIEAIAFVNQLVAPSEAAAHHPDIAISYNKVSITLTTHDAGGLTQKDFDLAKVISQLF